MSVGSTYCEMSAFMVTRSLNPPAHSSKELVSSCINTAAKTELNSRSCHRLRLALSLSPYVTLSLAFGIKACGGKGEGKKAERGKMRVSGEQGGRGGGRESLHMYNSSVKGGGGVIQLFGATADFLGVLKSFC